MLTFHPESKLIGLLRANAMGLPERRMAERRTWSRYDKSNWQKVQSDVDVTGCVTSKWTPDLTAGITLPMILARNPSIIISNASRPRLVAFITHALKWVCASSWISDQGWVIVNANPLIAIKQIDNES